MKASFSLTRRAALAALAILVRAGSPLHSVADLKGRKAGLWVKLKPAEAAALLAPVWGLDAATVEQANARRSYELRAVVAGALGEQRRIADTFFAEKLLSRKINALDVALFNPGV